MKKIAWITDSTASFSSYEVEKQVLKVLPLIVTIGEETFKENVSITPKEFYEKLKKNSEKASTSQPNLGEIAAIYEELKEQYEGAIVITLSSKLSGTYQAFNQAKEIAGWENVTVIDSLSAGYGIQRLIQKGRQLEKNGFSYGEIVKALNETNKELPFYVIPSDLDALKRSGRISSTQHFLGGILQVKPVISVEFGELKEKDKVRSEKSVTKWLINEMAIYEKNVQKIREIAIHHCEDPERAEKTKNTIHTSFPHANIVTIPFSIAIGLHAGKGTIGVIWN